MVNVLCAGCFNPLRGRQQKKYCSRSCAGKSVIKYYTEGERIEARRKQNAEHTKRYLQRVKDQTPPDADIPAIKEFYINCPDGHEVDHIYPIAQGGLHTLSNLQYLTVSENRKKGSKILSDQVLDNM